jgi:hypothetical protein
LTEFSLCLGHSRTTTGLAVSATHTRTAEADYRTKYLSGAIENPKINKAIVDILEGTMPAFQNRDSKYLQPSNL